uniref:Uncharacterized protein n=1 Tax=Wuchereria bancrofti TaxID=6293 RepID=A0A1I8ETD5_WUCBA
MVRVRWVEKVWRIPMAKSNKPNRFKSQNKASTVNNRFNKNDKVDLFNEISIDTIENLETWEEATSSWMKAAHKFCQLKDDEMRSEVYLQLAGTILLAPMKIRINNEFSVRPRSMIHIFEAWENIYDAVIDSCSQDSVLCCTFAIKLAHQIRHLIACEMDCRLLFVFSQIIRAQIEYFNYDILSDVFVGDFDLSGKGNVLDCFCKLLIEIRKRSIETLLKYADRQAGLALELMSKSILNILEAATSLVSLMAKPAHILFVIGALSEFISGYLTLMTEKSCRIFCKGQTNVIILVKTALTTLKKHYSGPYDSSLLGQLEPVFIKGLRISRLRHYLVNFWQQTFGRASHLDIVDELNTALEQAKYTPTNFVSEQQNFSILDDSKTSISCDTNLDSSMHESNGTVNENYFKQSPMKRTKPSVSKCRTLKHVKDESMEEYIVINASHSEKKMQLTNHQKEKLMERSDSLLCLAEESQSVDLAARIPPGYTDNSSQENSSTMKAPKTSLVKKCDVEYNCIGPSNTCVHSKNQDLLNGDINESDNHERDVVSGDINDDKTTVKKLIISEDRQNNETVCENKSSDLQNQTCAENKDGNKLASILLEEHVKDTERNILEEPKLSIRCKTPEIAESNLESASRKDNADELLITPNSILKKCERSSTYPTIKFFSASAKKCKRVHFDASTLDDDDIYGLPRRKIFRRSRNSLFFGLPPVERSEPTSPSKRLSVLPTNKNPVDAVFPPLVGSEELIPPQIYLKLAPTMSSLALRSLMKSRGVATVGDLACMSEEDIETFPFRDPKLSRFLRALEDHFRMKNMVSKEDAIELEKIMKRPVNSPSDCLKEVNLQPTDKCKALSPATVQEPLIADVPEALNKTVAGAFENKVIKASTEQSYVNPFQNGFNRFTPCSVKRLVNDETVTIGLDLVFFIPLSHKPVNNNDPVSVTALEKSDANNCVGCSSLSEHDNGEEKLTMKSPEKLSDKNIESSESRENNDMNNMKLREDADKLYDVNDFLRNAYRIFLEDSVVAAVAGICPIKKFSNEQLLSFSQACVSFQMAVLNSSKKINEE